MSKKTGPLYHFETPRAYIDQFSIDGNTQNKETLRDKETDQKRGRARRRRTQYTSYQMEVLEGEFSRNQYPDLYTRDNIARRIGKDEHRVQVRLSVSLKTNLF